MLDTTKPDGFVNPAMVGLCCVSSQGDVTYN